MNTQPACGNDHGLPNQADLAHCTKSEWKGVILQYVKEMSPVQQMILLAVVKAAFIDRVISLDVAEARSVALLKRHMAGEELRLSDLESIRAPVDKR